MQFVVVGVIRHGEDSVGQVELRYQGQLANVVKGEGVSLVHIELLHLKEHA